MCMHRECRERFPQQIAISFDVSGGEIFPTFPAHAQPTILRIW